MLLPSKLYAITSRDLSNCTHEEITGQLLSAGARLIQLRDKEASAKEMLEAARACLRLTRPAGATLIINDRADVALAADADGVHLGQDDLAVEEARELLGPDKIIGVSTHSLDEFREALETSANYIAVGPVFATTTKENPDPVVGLELVRAARQLTQRPLVAIGGVTIERAPGVIAAGADAVAVVSALYPIAGLTSLSDRPDIAGHARAFIEALSSQ